MLVLLLGKLELWVPPPLHLTQYACVAAFAPEIQRDFLDIGVYSDLEAKEDSASQQTHTG